jgi:hypothetical protein
LAISSRAAAQPLPEAEAEKRERATLLAQALPEAVELRSRSAVVPILGATGLGLAALGIAADWKLTAAGGALVAGGAVAFYFTPETRNYELLATTTSAGLGLMYLGFPFDEPHQRWQQPVGAAYLSQAALFALNTAYSPHPGRTQLVRDLRRVRTPAGRHGSTLLAGLGYAFTPSAANGYRDSQRRAGLWLTWAPLPGGVSVLGTFD